MRITTRIEVSHLSITMQNFTRRAQNLRSASYLAIANNIQFAKIPGSVVLEVGAGRSIYTEICPDWNLINRELILNDSSPEMLAYSSRAIEDGARTLLSDIGMVEVDEETVDCIVSSLGDPYNHDSFWDKCYQLLKTGGHVIYTAPSFHWASAFRKSDKYSQSVAEFMTATGNTFNMPSFVYSSSRQTDMIQRNGISVVSSGSVKLRDISSGRISPKIGMFEDSELPILDWYLCRK